MTAHLYSAFGHRLRSTIPLPELRPAEPGPVRWSFSVVDDLPEPEAAELVGEEHIYGSVSAKLFRHAAGHRIRIDDTGTYDLLAGGAEIRWQPNPDPWWDFGRSHLIGRVLATSLQLAGTVTFHASAVELRDGVVAFLAPKHFGKSTLAMTLVRAGARFVTDDSLAVECRRAPLALPGIQSLRVCGDDAAAARILGLEAARPPGRDGKVVLPPLPREQTLEAPARLAALYFLLPLRPAAGVPAAERAALPGILAAVRLVGQAKIGAMLGSTFAAALLDGASAVASAVPAYELAVVRDIDRLPELVDRLVEWHGLPAAVPATAGGG